MTIRDFLRKSKDGDLSMRAYNVLHHNYVDETMERFCSRTRVQLWERTKNAGPVTISEIEQALAKQGFSLKWSKPTALKIHGRRYGRP